MARGSIVLQLDVTQTIAGPVLLIPPLIAELFEFLEGGSTTVREIAVEKLGGAVASFRNRVRFWLEVITPSQNLCRSIGCAACVTRTQISLPPLSPLG